MDCREWGRWVWRLPTVLAAYLFLLHALLWLMVASGIEVGYMPWWVVRVCAAVVRWSIFVVWLIWGV